MRVAVVEQAIGKNLNGTTPKRPHAGKNPHAVALGRLGGQKGGMVIARKLSAKKRRVMP